MLLKILLLFLALLKIAESNSVPVVWKSSPFFTSGTYPHKTGKKYFSNQNNNFNVHVTITYSPAFSLNTARPILSISQIDLRMANGDNNFSMVVSTYSTTQFTVNIKSTLAIPSLDFRYLSVSQGV